MKLTLKSFEQHGFELLQKDASGGQIRGLCPFCGKKKFFLNEAKGLWDCKVCGRAGNSSSFLAQINEMTTNALKESRETVEWLAELRGLTPGTLLAWDFGFNIQIEKFTLPYRDCDNKLTTLKLYNPVDKSFINTASRPLQLFGLDKVKSNAETIWLCEGEWDALAIWEALKAEGRLDSESVIAVPGATQWKDNWSTYFLGKKVNVLYDADEPGLRGMQKVKDKIGSIADLNFIDWEKSRPKGFDIRDLLIECQSDYLTYLQKIESLLSKSLIISESKENPKECDQELKKDYECSGEYIAPADVYKMYQKWLYMPNTNVIDILYGTVLANRLEGDPVWLFLVAPSGGTKSELLMSLAEAEQIFSATTLSPASLISGMSMGTGDPSLIPKLDQQILIVKDFTTILNMNVNARDEIFGILRDAYDGKIEKMFGNGVMRTYTSKFGIIAGTTPAIELYADEYVALGERFLRWREDTQGDTSELVLRALMNSNKENSMRADLSDIGKKVLAYRSHKIPEISEENAKVIVALAQLVACLRGTVNRDKFTKEITHRPFQELGTRLAKQFFKLGMGIAMFHGRAEITEHELNLIRRLAWTTCSTRMTDTIDFFLGLEDGAEIEPSKVSDALRLPKPTIQRILENLVMLGALEKITLSLGLSKYKMTYYIRDLIEKAGFQR